MKVKCTFAFNIMKLYIAKYSTYDNRRDQTTANPCNGTQLLPPQTRQEPKIKLSVPRRQNPKLAALLQNTYLLLLLVELQDTWKGNGRN